MERQNSQLHTCTPVHDWHPVSNPPPANQPEPYGPFTSGPVVVYRKSGGQSMARYETWGDVWEDDDVTFRWVTDDSEGWDITRDVLFWRPQFPAPVVQEG